METAGTIKVYSKSGNTTYKEKNLITAIRQAVSERRAKDPNFQFRIAENFEELQALHKELTIESVPYENVSGGDNNSEPQNDEANSNNEPSTSTGADLGDPNLDPLNRHEPNIRGYVTTDEYAKPGAQQASSGPRTFGEPISFEQGFRIPNAEDNPQQPQGDNPQGDNTQSNNGGGGGSGVPPTGKNPPATDNNQNAPDPEKRKKNTKRFARRVVKMALNFLEKGYVWWTTKDINAATLAELELNGDIDFRFMLTLENGQEIGIKQFFAQRERAIVAASKFTDENREDLVEDLTEYLLERNISPSNGQILFITFLETVGAKFADAAQEKIQNIGIVTSLKTATQNQRSNNPEYQEEGDFNQFDEPANNQPPADNNTENTPPGDDADQAPNPDGESGDNPPA